MNVVCLILSTDSRYDNLVACASSSFAYFHPDIEIIIVDESNYPKYGIDEKKFRKSPGAAKFEVAAFLLRNGFDKVIALGADTITCSRLEEFLENKEDIQATLDYPYQMRYGNFSVPFFAAKLSEPLKVSLIFTSVESEKIHKEYGVYDYTHANADVVCFSNPEAVDRVLYLSYNSHFLEQGGLNLAIWENNGFSKKIVDCPYFMSSVLYNVRSKGNVCHDSTKNNFAEHTQKFEIEDEQLYTRNPKRLEDRKLIRVFHYCDGFGNHKDNSKFQEIYSQAKREYFNAETVAFFQKICGNFYVK